MMLASKFQNIFLLDGADIEMCPCSLSISVVSWMSTYFAMFQALLKWWDVCLKNDPYRNGNLSTLLKFRETTTISFAVMLVKMKECSHYICSHN